MLRTMIATIASLLLMSESGVQADLILDLVSSNSSTVTSGSMVSIDLILRDTDNSHFGPTAGIGSTALGLLSGGGKLIQSGTTGAAAVVTGPPVGGNFGFPVPQTSAQLNAPGLGGVLALALVPPVGLTGTAHIATFTAMITGLAGTSVTISADTLGLNAVVPSPSPVNGNQLFGVSSPANNLDAVLGSFHSPGAGASFASLTFEVAAVPEPSTLVVALLVAGGAGLRWKRRQRAIATDSPDATA